MKALLKYGAILLIGLLLFPSIVEFTHIFAGHQHKTCTNYSDSHFHGKNVECKLFSFQKTNFSFPDLAIYELFTPEILVVKISVPYLFLSTRKSSAFEQRGPPAMI